MVKLCSVDGCTHTFLAKGLCRMHYERVRRGEPLGSSESKIVRKIGVCNVKGCYKEDHKQGMCEAHYMRKRRTGVVGKAKIKKVAVFGEPMQWLLEVALRHKVKGACLKWPYARSGGYAMVSGSDTGSSIAPRVICEKIYGKPPTKRHQACHSCGKGHEGCVNRHHLYWGTPEENWQDRIRHKNMKEHRRGA